MRTQHKKSILEKKANQYAHIVYNITKKFPSEEKFGITSQFRRSSPSIVLNIIEGFARGNKKENINFLRISYASLQESIYLLEFCKEENLIQETDFESTMNIADEISAMLWKSIKTLKENSG